MRSALIALLAFSSLVHAGPKEDAKLAFDQRDYKKAVELLIPLAEAGDADSLGNLGNMYAFGQGVDQDLIKAAALWTRAADKGLGTAMGNLAQLYATGVGGVQKSETIAVGWYKKAAEHRHVPSMVRLGALYALGNGVEKDHVRALAWSGLAASNAADPRVQAAAEKQTRDFSSILTQEEITKAQNLTESFRATIDANIARYKAQ